MNLHAESGIEESKNVAKVLMVYTLLTISDVQNCACESREQISEAKSAQREISMA